jgi:L-fuculokinase
MNVVVIFDIGKTNKKAFIFDEDYQIVWQKSTNFAETADEDGDACEDIELLTKWVRDCWEEAKTLENFKIKAINFSTYGASMVYTGIDDNTLTPLYNYLKAYPQKVKEKFYQTNGGEEAFAMIAASPVLGSLNSGMQVFRIKEERPALFEQIKYSLHLPQYLSFLFTGQYYADHTSIGCHTNLWDFTKMNYHEWVSKEKIADKLPDIRPAEACVLLEDGTAVGPGLHDSSSALIPYLINFKEPFLLISTGTWSISLNPFNATPLTYEEIQYDCLCYLDYKAKPVKAARLFAGNEHEIQTKRLAEHFSVAVDYYKNVSYDKTLIDTLQEERNEVAVDKYQILRESAFKNRALAQFQTYEIAYHQLMLDIINQQIISTELVIYNSPVQKIFVDGGFSKNPIFMNLLAESFPEIEVYAASIAQASALGAALAIHKTWNSKPVANNLIDLKYYSYL